MAKKGFKRKLNSGFPALNKILNGGFSVNKSIVLEGAPGSGKGLIAFTFMKQGLLDGAKVFYICMNEIREDIKELFLSLGIDSEAYEKKNKLKILNLYKHNDPLKQRVYNEDEQLMIKDFSIIKKEIDEFIKPTDESVRCVFNIISQAYIEYDPKVVYSFMLKLNDFIKEKGITALFFMHKGVIETDNVISIEEVMDGAVEFIIKEEDIKVTRYIKIKKMKPEFSVLPQFYIYNFDKKKNLSITSVNEE
jgi:KaiC/GvpD/RAD55 family RecA-like ATPase